MNKDTPTPRTDALMHEFKAECAAGKARNESMADAVIATGKFIDRLDELACALERELSASRERVKELEGARKLVTVIFAEDRGDIDGGWLQDEAVKHGVLIEVEATERCVDPDAGNCACAEYGDFPMTCYRVNPALLTQQE